MATDRSSLSVKFKAFISGVVGYDAGLGTSGNPIPDSQIFTASKAITFGTGDGEANQWWYDRRKIAASQTDSIDLVGGLTTPSGHAIVPLVLKGIFIHQRSFETLTTAAHGLDHTASAATLDVVRPAANGVPWVKTADVALPIGVKGFFAWYNEAGVAITADTGDLLDIIATAALEAVYDIALLFEE